MIVSINIDNLADAVEMTARHIVNRAQFLRRLFKEPVTAVEDARISPGSHSFPDEDIVDDAKEVLKNLTPIDREVSAMNNRFYTLRIAPYRTTENSIKGLVITIIDSLGVGQENIRTAQPV